MMSNYLHALRGRNIPAYAGRTKTLKPVEELWAKHPRIRGENVCSRGWCATDWETSPHTRGKRILLIHSLRWLRNIPAYAGKTTSCQKITLGSRKHPRIRGENPSASAEPGIVTETSPHTRGKPFSCLKSECPDRNIPAYAGKTYSTAFQRWVLQKHPRIRGENYTFWIIAPSQPETSPHTRGKLCDARYTRLDKGNIPAYAGKTFDSGSSGEQDRKHPRIRGENVFRGLPFFRYGETSPHTRGKLNHPHGNKPWCRNIPAYAGKTIPRSVFDRSHGKHPRIRGENGVPWPPAERIGETSPHTRGKLARRSLCW